MRCKVLSCRVDRIQGNSVTQLIFAPCHKIVTKREFFKMITDSGVDAF